MELLEAIYRRRAVRNYTEARVASSTIEELITAAIQAPSALNQQPWAFAVFQGKERLKSYSDRAKAHFLAVELPAFGLHERGDTLTDPDYNIFYNATTCVVILARDGTLSSAGDCHLAAQTLMLAAHGMGLATCPIGIARPWMNLPQVKNELGILPQYNAVFPVALGYPASARADSPKSAGVCQLEIVSGSRPVEPPPSRIFRAGRIQSCVTAGASRATGRHPRDDRVFSSVNRRSPFPVPSRVSRPCPVGMLKESGCDAPKPGCKSRAPFAKKRAEEMKRGAYADMSEADGRNHQCHEILVESLA